MKKDSITLYTPNNIVWDLSWEKQTPCLWLKETSRVSSDYERYAHVKCEIIPAFVTYLDYQLRVTIGDNNFSDEISFKNFVEEFHPVNADLIHYLDYTIDYSI